MALEIPCTACGNAAAEISLTGAQAAELLATIAGDLPLGMERILTRLMTKAADDPGTVLGLAPAEFSAAFGVRCIACVDGGPAGGPYSHHREDNERQ